MTATRGRHAAHYVTALERATAAGGNALAQLIGRVAPQVQAAHEWFVATGDADGVLRLATQFVYLTFFPGITVAGLAARFAAALEVPGALHHPLAPGVLALEAELFLETGGDPFDAYATALRSLALADDIGVDPTPIQLGYIGTVAMRSGQLDEGCEIALRGVVAAERVGDDRGAALSSIVVSMGERYRGDLGAAADAGRRGEAAARRAGADDLVAGNLLMQGFALREAEPERALAFLDEGARLARSVSPDMQYLLYCVQNAGLIRLRLGDRPGARPGFDEAIDICAPRTVGYEYAAHTAAHLALGLLDVGDSHDASAAVVLFAAAEQLASPIALYAGMGIGPDDLTTRFGTVLDVETIADLRTRGASDGL